MTYNQAIYDGYTPPQSCLHCGDPIKQPRHGGRYRLYCSDKCRKAGNRSNHKFEHDQAKANLLRQLKKDWQKFDQPTTVWTLEHEILRNYGVGAAALATRAIQQELEARVKNPIVQAEFERIIKRQMELDRHSQQ